MPKDTHESILRELAQHLQHDASLRRYHHNGDDVGMLVLSYQPNSLWRRVLAIVNQPCSPKSNSSGQPSQP